MPGYWGGEIPWISLHDTDGLDAWEISSTRQTITDAGLANSSARLLPKGTVVFSRTATVGKATVMGQAMATSQDFACYVCGPEVHNFYLSILLRSMRAEWKKLMAGSIHNTVYMPVFKTLRVNLPPVAEQVTIASAMFDVEQQIESLGQLLAKKRQIKQGAMQELLSGKRRLPGFTETWSRDELWRLVQTPITDGPHSTPVFYESGVPFLSVNNLSGNRIDLTDLRFISKEDDQLFAKKCKPRKGDVLLGKAASVGKVAIVEDDMDFNIWSPIALVRAGEMLDPKFLYYQLQSTEATTQITLLTNSSSQGNIGMGDIERLRISHPCVDEQKEIARTLSDMDTDLFILEARLTKARALKEAMAQVLLTGRIRLVETTA